MVVMVMMMMMITQFRFTTKHRFYHSPLEITHGSKSCCSSHYPEWIKCTYYASTYLFLRTVQLLLSLRLEIRLKAHCHSGEFCRKMTTKPFKLETTSTAPRTLKAGESMHKCIWVKGRWEKVVQFAKACRKQVIMISTRFSLVLSFNWEMLLGILLNSKQSSFCCDVTW